MSVDDLSSAASALPGGDVRAMPKEQWIKARAKMLADYERDRQRKRDAANLALTMARYTPKKDE